MRTPPDHEVRARPPLRSRSALHGRNQRYARNRSTILDQGFRPASHTSLRVHGHLDLASSLAREVAQRARVLPIRNARNRFPGPTYQARLPCVTVAGPVRHEPRRRGQLLVCEGVPPGTPGSKPHNLRISEGIGASRGNRRARSPSESSPHFFPSVCNFWRIAAYRPRRRVAALRVRSMLTA